MKLKNKLTCILTSLSLAMLLGCNFISDHDNPHAMEDSTLIQMKQLGMIIEDYRRACGKFPTTEQGWSMIDFKLDITCKPLKHSESSLRRFNDAWGVPLKYSSDAIHFYRIESSHGQVVTGP